MLWLLSRPWGHHQMMVAQKVIPSPHCTFSQDRLQTRCKFSFCNCSTCCHSRFSVHAISWWPSYIDLIVHCSLGTFLACTEQGKASIRSITKENAASGSDVGPSATWDVCSGANVQFCSVDHGESYAMFGG